MAHLSLTRLARASARDVADTILEPTRCGEMHLLLSHQAARDRVGLRRSGSGFGSCLILTLINNARLSCQRPRPSFSVASPSIDKPIECRHDDPSLLLATPSNLLALIESYAPSPTRTGATPSHAARLEPYTLNHDGFNLRWRRLSRVRRRRRVRAQHARQIGRAHV